MIDSYAKPSSEYSPGTWALVWSMGLTRPVWLMFT